MKRSTSKKNTTVKGIRIADYHQVGTTPIGSTAADTVEVTDDTTNPATTTQTMTVPVGNLKIFKIMSDGSEVAMTDSEKAALTGTNFIVSYTYDSESGDKESFGHASPATNDFSYDDTAEDESNIGRNPSIVVHNSQKYENGVYTLKAKYKTDANTEFTTTFDLVFLRSSTKTQKNTDLSFSDGSAFLFTDNILIRIIVHLPKIILSYCKR